MGIHEHRTEVRGHEMEELPDGEVIRELSKGTRLHQEEPGGRGGQSEESGAGVGSIPSVSAPPPAHPTPAGKFSKPQPLGFVWRPEVGKSYGKLWARCKVSFN